MKNPFSLKGRASRTEFLLFFLLYCSCLIFYMTKYSVELASGPIDFHGSTLTLVILLFLLILLTTVSVRRIHDIGFSGWWQILVCILPILILVLIIKKGDQETNLYGEQKSSGSPQWLNKSLKFIAGGAVNILGSLIIYYLTFLFIGHIDELRLEKAITFSLIAGPPMTLLSGFLAGLTYEIGKNYSESRWSGIFIISIISFFASSITMYGLWLGNDFGLGFKIFSSLILIIVAASIAAGLFMKFHELENGMK